MNDYHQRFRERFQNTDPHLRNWMQDAVRIKEVLAFIDEVVTELSEDPNNVNYIYLTREEAYQRGRAEERASLIEKVEEMKIGESRTDIHDNPAPAEAWIRGKTFGRNEALDDLLTHLRGEEKVHSCCWNSENHIIGVQCKPRPQSGIQEETEYCPHGASENCPVGCHKPRTEETEFTGQITYYKPRLSTNATLGLRKTEKEGASFSGRDETEKWNFTIDTFVILAREHYWDSLQESRDTVLNHVEEIARLARQSYKPRPKETTTPQSREQGGEEFETSAIIRDGERIPVEDPPQASCSRGCCTSPQDKCKGHSVIYGVVDETNQ